MSQNIAVLTLTVTATEVISAHTCITATGGVAAAAGNALGVARTDAEIGEVVAVDVLGTTQVIASDAVEVGDAVEVDAGGAVLPNGTGVMVGRSLVTTGGPGDIIEVLLIPN